RLSDATGGLFRLNFAIFSRKAGTDRTRGTLSHVSHLSLRIFLRKALSLIKAANAPGSSSPVAESNKNEAIAALQQLEPREFGVQLCPKDQFKSKNSVPPSSMGHFQRLPSYPVRIRLHSSNCTRRSLPNSCPTGHSKTISF